MTAPLDIARMVERLAKHETENREFAQYAKERPSFYGEHEWKLAINRADLLGEAKAALLASDASITALKQQLSDVEHSRLTITNHISRERIASDALIKRAGGLAALHLRTCDLKGIGCQACEDARTLAADIAEKAK